MCLEFNNWSLVLKPMYKTENSKSGEEVEMSN